MITIISLHCNYINCINEFSIQNYVPYVGWPYSEQDFQNNIIHILTSICQTFGGWQIQKFVNVLNSYVAEVEYQLCDDRTSLRITSNPFWCDNTLCWLFNTFHQPHHTYASKYPCAEPATMKNISWKQLPQQLGCGKITLQSFVQLKQ